MLILFAVITVVIVGGCGGHGVEYQKLTGDYFPLEEGRQWHYDVTVTTYFGNLTASTTGTTTRTVTEHTMATSAATAMDIATCTNTFSPMPVPDVGQELCGPIARYAQYLFSSEGGLRDWNEYYTLHDSNGDGQPNRIVFSAAGAPDAPPIETPRVQPFLPVPTFAGLASTNSLPLSMIPFYTNNATLHDSTVRLKIQQRIADHVIGDGVLTDYASVVETLQATIFFDGQRGACTGKAITDIARDYGPIEKNIDLEFRLSDCWLRLWILVRYLHS
jgi:hypothetical protein